MIVVSSLTVAKKKIKLFAIIYANNSRSGEAKSEKKYFNTGLILMFKRVRKQNL